MSIGTQNQLVAEGPQDHFLRDDNGVDPFTGQWHRHTEFVTRPLEVPLEVGFGGTVQYLLASGADMLGAAHLRVVLPQVMPVTRWPAGVGFAVVQQLQVRLGAVVVTDLNSDSLEIRSRLFDTSNALDLMLGRQPLLSTACQQELLIPLPVFWTRAKFLPLVAIYNTPLQFNLTLRDAASLTSLTSVVSGAPAVSLVFEAIDLCDKERSAMLSGTSTLMFEQIKLLKQPAYVYTGGSDVVCLDSVSIDLSGLTGATKYLAWVCLPLNPTAPFSYVDVLQSVQLLFDGVPYDERRDDLYHRCVHPSQCVPCVPVDSNIAVWSFALQAGLSQPTGELDFGATGKSVLQLGLKTTSPCDVLLLSCSYNLLTISNGFASTKFI